MEPIGTGLFVNFPASILASAFPVLDSYIERLRGPWTVPWRESIELFLIGIVVYSTLRFLEGTRGARLLRAVLLILTMFLVVAIFARFLGLDRILFMYPYFVGAVFLIALVVFQIELRRGLMRIGETIGRRSLSAEYARVLEPIVQAAANLSRRKIGALIALERQVPMGALIENGVPMNAEVSRELLETIFWPGSALHDLGVVISHGRIAAAGCEFPLAEPGVADRVMGSRHRAALGLSLETDALVLVVSEETGNISIAERGKLRTELNAEELRELLSAGLLGFSKKQPARASIPEKEPAEIDDANGESPSPSAALQPRESKSANVDAAELAGSKVGE